MIWRNTVEDEWTAVVAASARRRQRLRADVSCLSSNSTLESFHKAQPSRRDAITRTRVHLAEFIRRRLIGKQTVPKRIEELVVQSGRIRGRINAGTAESPGR